MDKIKEKLLNREVIMYVIFGIATTLVNLIVSFILEGIVNLNGEIASAIGIIASILFAYFTRPFLYYSLYFLFIFTKQLCELFFCPAIVTPTAHPHVNS